MNGDYEDNEMMKIMTMMMVVMMKLMKMMTLPLNYGGTHNEKKNTLKLKYSYKGSGLIRINIDLHHHSEHCQKRKALTNKLYRSIRSEHNIWRHKFGHHFLSSKLPHQDVH